MPHIFATIVHHPFSYQVGPFTLTGFGLAILLTFVIAQIISQHEMERRGHDPTVMGDLVFAAVVGGLLGAKIYYAILMHDWHSLASRAGCFMGVVHLLDPDSSWVVALIRRAAGLVHSRVTGISLAG